MPAAPRTPWWNHPRFWLCHQMVDLLNPGLGMQRRAIVAVVPEDWLAFGNTNLVQRQLQEDRFAHL
eukprot:2113929-Lingulodinium_polyedra.AAC.1